MTEGCLLLPEPGQPNISFLGQAIHTQEGDEKFLPASPPLAYPPGDKCPCTALINSPGTVCNRHQERMVRPSPHFQPPWTLPSSVQAGPAGQGGKECTIPRVPQMSQSIPGKPVFPALPRLSSRGSTHNTVARETALREILVGKLCGKDSSENHRSIDPSEGKRDNAASAREESARACPNSFFLLY